jgi:hypothetical protein
MDVKVECDVIRAVDSLCAGTVAMLTWLLSLHPVTGREEGKVEVVEGLE